MYEAKVAEAANTKSDISTLFEISLSEKDVSVIHVPFSKWMLNHFATCDVPCAIVFITTSILLLLLIITTDLY